MSWLTESWIFASRLRRRIGKPSTETWLAERHRFIEEHAPGRSFADIGGLFQLHGDIAFRAEAAGATAVTLFDAGDESYADWRQGSKVRFVQGDLEEPRTIERVGPHQVVWCAGVLYHTPNPLLQLMHLREITTELLFLGTRTIPEVPGLDQACVFYPYLDAPARRAHSRAYWDAEYCYAIGTPFDDRPMHGYGNFWWGITPSALRAMLTSARFEIVEERRAHDYPWAVDVVARPIDEDPVLPPRSYYRERGEQNERGGPELPFDDYYEFAREREAG